MQLVNFLCADKRFKSYLHDADLKFDKQGAPCTSASAVCPRIKIFLRK